MAKPTYEEIVKAVGLDNFGKYLKFSIWLEEQDIGYSSGYIRSYLTVKLFGSSGMSKQHMKNIHKGVLENWDKWLEFDKR